MDNMQVGYSVNFASPPLLGQKQSLYTTYPGNITSCYRNSKINDRLRGTKHTDGVQELIYDPLSDVAKGLCDLQEARRKRTHFSKSRDTFLPGEKTAVRQYASFSYTPMSLVRSVPHYYHSGVPPFALDRIPATAPQTRTLLGDKQLPHDRMTVWTVQIDDIPVGGRAFVGLLQDSTSLKLQHLTSANPLLFWTDLWEARIEGCGLDLWRMYDGRLRLTLRHLPTREDNEYLGRTVPVNDTVIGEVYPPDSFTPPSSKMYDVEDRISTIKGGLEVLSKFREQKAFTQYTKHTRSVPSFVDRPPVENVLQMQGPLEVKVTTKEAKTADTGSRNILGMEVRFTVGDMEGVVAPLRTWDASRGMKRYRPCIGLGKNVVVVKDRERYPADFQDEHFWSTFMDDLSADDKQFPLSVGFPSLVCNNRQHLFGSTRGAQNANKSPTWASRRAGKSQWSTF